MSTVFIIFFINFPSIPPFSDNSGDGQWSDQRPGNPHRPSSSAGYHRPQQPDLQQLAVSGTQRDGHVQDLGQRHRPDQEPLPRLSQGPPVQQQCQLRLRPVPGSEESDRDNQCQHIHVRFRLHRGWKLRVSRLLHFYVVSYYFRNYIKSTY